MAFYRHHDLQAAALTSVTIDTKLPSFNQFVSSLEHINPDQQRHASLPEGQRPNPFSSLPSPLQSSTAHRVYEPRRSSFSNLLNPASEVTPGLGRQTSPPKPASSWRPFQTPRDAYQVRQGLMQAMKPLQPRGDIPAYRPTPELTLRSSSVDNDLTLAGKPRKRSAQACQRCREMKIKCRAHGTGCITCLRQGLECTFEPARSGLRNRRSKRDKDSKTDADQASTSDATNSPPAKRLCASERRNVDNSEEASPVMSFNVRSRIPLLTHDDGHISQRALNIPGHQRLDQDHTVSATLPFHRSVSSTSFPPTPPDEQDKEHHPTTLRRVSSASSSGTSTVEAIKVENFNHGSSSTSAATVTIPPQQNLAVDEDPFEQTPSLAISALRNFYASRIYKQVADTCIADGSDGAALPSIEAIMVKWPVKPTKERMLLYAMLAAGATVATNASSRLSDRDALEMMRFGRRCREAVDACMATVDYMFDKVVVQTQLILRADKVG